MISARSQSCATNKTLAVIFIWIAIALDCKIAAVAHDVRVGHDAIAVDHKTGANAAAEHSRVPRRAIIWRNFGGRDADQAFLNRSVRLRRRDGDRNSDDVLWRSRLCSETQAVAVAPVRFPVRAPPFCGRCCWGGGGC